MPSIKSNDCYGIRAGERTPRSRGAHAFTIPSSLALAYIGERKQAIPSCFRSGKPGRKVFYVRSVTVSICVRNSVALRVCNRHRLGSFMLPRSNQHRGSRQSLCFIAFYGTTPS
ncbi:unnamed protein product [Periconia digitata]|uniref:Uncharacterized protein n=1 Tax=Periconia digitata TaxID=1303443 RepID=A0A9W4UHN8_9PLEO|nr:unnamed protein product [Periconia digitata]